MARAGRRTYVIAGIVAGALALLVWQSGLVRPHAGGDADGVTGSADRTRAAAASRAGALERSLALQQQRAADEKARHLPSAPGAPSRAMLEARLERAETVLARYRETTKYPHSSRPLREQPDQVQPHHVSPHRLPLTNDGDQVGQGILILRQSHFYLAGDEAVTFTVECGTSEGPAPCEVQSATATAAATGTAAGAGLRAEVSFTAAASGAMHTATFAPAAQGFAKYHGPIHVALAVRIGEEEGIRGFDIEYTPRAPAVFTGRVNERLVDGSLVLGVELEIDEPGRYVIAARVDDATGRSFAYLSFNEELPRGTTEAALVLFGKLVLDEQALAPFRLRDVEGFLLAEDQYPDRKLLATLEGVVHTTREYGGRDFSDAEWQSEERDRYLDELGRDVDRARRELEDAAR